MNAFKRIRNGKEPTTYSVRFEFKGRGVLKKTPFTNKEDALSHGRALLAALHKQGWAALKQVALRQPAAAATLGQIFEAYRRLAGPIQELANETTLQGNLYALRNILIRVHILPEADRIDTRQLTPAQLTQIHNLPAAALTGDLIKNFKTNAFHRAQKQDPIQAASTYRSANSIVLQARALFTPELLDEYKHEGLQLPDLTDFLQKPLFNKTQKDEYHAAPDALIAKTFADLPELEQTDPHAYLAIWLAMGFGLRRSEICRCKPSWFIQQSGAPHLHFQHATKNGAIEFMGRCQLDAWPHLQPHVDRATSDAAPYLLHENNQPLNKHSDLWRRLGLWMRGLGWQTQKTIHEFRALAGCKIVMACGLLAGKEFLRHKTITTTERFYGRYIRLQIDHVPLQLPTLTAPTLLPADPVSNPVAAVAS